MFEINEDDVIGRLKKQFPNFIGDDAAVIPSDFNNSYVITKDALIEDVHFRVKYFTAADLAHKSIHVNLSDIAAMGARPVYVLCAIAIPVHLRKYSVQFLENLSEICKELGVILIGGDTTSSISKLFISITAVGLVENDNIKLRSMSEVGDVICVAGNIAFSHLGYLAAENGLESEYMESFLRPEARIKEGKWLAKKMEVTSMMDVSDGLCLDLKKLCKASSCGAVIDLEMLQNHLEPGITIEMALESGEDYSLLFTVKKERFRSVFDEFKRVFQYDIKQIGYITTGKEVLFKQNDELVDLLIRPFSHFGENI